MQLPAGNASEEAITVTDHCNVVQCSANCNVNVVQSIATLCHHSHSSLQCEYGATNCNVVQ